MARAVDRPRSAASCSSGVGPVEASLDRLERQRLGHGQRFAWHCERDVAGVGPQGGAGREHGRAGHPGSASDDEHRARRVLRVVRRPERHLAQDRVGGSPRIGVCRREADVGDDDATRVEPPGRGYQADLAPVEGDGERCGDGRSGDLACRGVDAGRQVDGDHGGSARVDPLDQRRRFRSWGAVEPRPEQRVDDDVVAFGVVGLDCLSTRLSHHPRRDPPVASVGAAAADHPEAARARVGAHRLARHRRACALHQLACGVGVARVSLLRGTHLRGRVEGLQHARHPARATVAAHGRRRPRRRHRPSCASASARRRSRAARPARRTRASCRAGSPLVSGGPRSRSPSR